ncbi:MAG: FAD:protein FMN transferase [Candidatus Aureabacteria bacterium]|nr:FAD:protein FMN transferase [Candidatus Auribacterota bacterium]
MNLIEKRSIILLVSGTLIIAVLFFRKTESVRLYSSHPAGIMGTDSLLVVIASSFEHEKAMTGLHEAENELRKLEALMSVHLEQSELSRFNSLPANQKMILSDKLSSILNEARKAWFITHGRFDVTCYPLISLWNKAGKENRLPDPDKLQEARNCSSWEQIHLNGQKAVKFSPTVRLDLGGIAKGLGVDQAIEKLKSMGFQGGMVNVGGDLRVYGKPLPGKTAWEVEVRNPFQNEIWAILKFSRKGKSVCTSGNYYRFIEINRKRYSHIINPRTHQNADRVPSVTVIAPTAIEADVWATALSISGPKGLVWLKKHPLIHAMLVMGTMDDCRIYHTKGFMEYLFPLPSFPEKKKWTTIE